MSKEPPSGGDGPAQSGGLAAGSEESVDGARGTRRGPNQLIEPGNVGSSNTAPALPRPPPSELPFDWYAMKAFADPELVRRLKEIEDNRPQIKGKRYQWTPPTGYHEVDPHPEWTEKKRQLEQAVREDFHARVDTGEIEVVGVPIYSPDGQDQVIPARRVRALGKRRGVLYFCPGGKWREGCPGWIDVRVRRVVRAESVVADAKDKGLKACIQSRLDRGDRPGDTIDWKTFCDLVRDERDGWTEDAKSLNRKTPRRGYSNRSIERIVKRLKRQ